MKDEKKWGEKKIIIKPNTRLGRSNFMGYEKLHKRMAAAKLEIVAGTVRQCVDSSSR